MRQTRRLLVLASAVLLAACTAPAAPTGSPTEPTGSPAATDVPASSAARPATSDSPDGVLPGYASDVDEFAPLVITAIAPDPIPFTGTDGKVHVTYELQVLNFSPRPATITQVQTLQGGPDGQVLATMPQDEVAARTLLVADYPTAAAPVTEIPPGRVALLLLDDLYDSRAEVPAEVTHRVDASFGEVPPGQIEFADRYPTTVSQIGGRVTTSAVSPVVIGAPLAGDGWWAPNGCCTTTAHRVGMLPIGGRINAVERFAIDWMRLDVTAKGLRDEATGLVASFHGDPTRNESYLAYGQPLLAVADGTVVAVTSGQTDAAPQHMLSGLRLDQLGGNTIAVDIGDGVKAFYAHLPPGGAKVKVGDRVERGQVLGVLGNTGNTSEPHLHFHLMRSQAPLSGDNVPWEIDQLTFVGSAGEEGLVAGPDAGPRTNQYPLVDSITNFPAAP